MYARARYKYQDQRKYPWHRGGDSRSRSLGLNSDDGASSMEEDEDEEEGEEEEEEEWTPVDNTACMICGLSSDPNLILLCDGCDKEAHLACVGLSQVPAGDWFCSSCRVPHSVPHAPATRRPGEPAKKKPGAPALRPETAALMRTLETLEDTLGTMETMNALQHAGFLGSVPGTGADPLTATVQSGPPSLRAAKGRKASKAPRAAKATKTPKSTSSKASRMPKASKAFKVSRRTPKASRTPRRRSQFVKAPLTSLQRQGELGDLDEVDGIVIEAFAGPSGSSEEPDQLHHRGPGSRPKKQRRPPPPQPQPRPFRHQLLFS